MSLPNDYHKILIVDDEPLNIEVLSSIVERFGDVLFATDGQTAISICKDEKPDLVLLDIMMPEMDGYDVCRALRNDDETKDIPVIFVSALSEENDEATGLELGAVDYITKPLSAPITTARVRNHLKLKSYRDHLENIAFIDALTQVPNRRRFNEVAETEWKRSIRTEKPVSVLLMDIDHFKQYNDHYGHQAGDDCLAAVARALQSAMRRPADFLARYGGEEFVCLLPETDLEGARIFAESICKTVTDLEIPHEKSSVGPHLSMSVGAASAVADDVLPLEKVIGIADDALYEAKKKGRNQVSARLAKA